ncbi:MAG: nickel pincer cofactor biosynthesis protein LarC [Chloroflexi bacterium]|nr:nickel pincer cofactor biosynthesis protein LarC [Chloroflexota bacterium]
MRIGYFHVVAGASGDMLLGAFLDCGLTLDSLKQELEKLGVSFQLSVRPARRGPVTGTQVRVRAPEKKRPTLLPEVLAIIKQSNLSSAVKEKSSLVFRRLAEAEGRVHRLPPGEVPLHQVGATDALVDIVGAVVSTELLGLELYCSPLPTGIGEVKAGGETYPVPAPATLELVAMARAPIMPSYPAAEVLTPTAAAILTNLASFVTPVFSLEKVGYGIGHRRLKGLPNVLPLWLGERAQPLPSHRLLLAETNIDDMSPQLFENVMGKLFQKGALDVWLTPVQMKKGRPGLVLSCLFPPQAQAGVVDTVLRETSTLGVRLHPVERQEADREIVAISSPLGKVRIKVKRLRGKVLGATPEYEDCLRLAGERGLPLPQVYNILSAAIADYLAREEKK